MGKSRTDNSIRNSLAVIISKMVSLVFSFALRTIFISLLGKEILGLDGLFTNVIVILNIVDLGLGTTIIFVMYKSIAEGNEGRTVAILSYLNKFYRIIGYIILCIGLVLTPLIPRVVTTEDKLMVIISYILAVVGSAVTYFLADRRSLFEASQDGYIISIVDSIVSILSSIFRILVLYLTKSYTLYLGVVAVMAFVSNVITYHLGNKKYTYIKTIERVTLTHEEKKDLLGNFVAVFTHKLGSILSISISNILISILLNTTLVGIYSNYLLILNTIMTLVTIAITAVTPSVGNLKESENDVSREYSVYKLVNFVTFWLVSMTTICLVSLFNPFLSTWLDKSFTFDILTVILLCISYYLNTMRQSVVVFETAGGYLKKIWYKPLIEAVINVIVSLLLVGVMGINGIFLGSIISILLCSFWVDPYITYKHWFKKPLHKYFLNYLLEVVITILVGVGVYFLTNIINFGINKWINLIIQAIVCLGGTNLALLLLSFRRGEFITLWDKLKSKLLKSLNIKEK